MKITAQIKNLNRAIDGVTAEKRRIDKAFTAAMKVEGFRLRKSFMRDVKSGRAGRVRHKEATRLSRWRVYGRRWRGPWAWTNLGFTWGGSEYSLIDAVRYWTKPGEVHIGWTGPGVSESWRGLAVKAQRGARYRVTDEQRRYFAQLADSKYGPGKRSQFRKYFFIKKSTTHFTTPARPMIEPFLAAHGREVVPNVRRNFVRKMRGERI